MLKLKRPIVEPQLPEGEEWIRRRSRRRPWGCEGPEALANGSERQWRVNPEVQHGLQSQPSTVKGWHQPHLDESISFSILWCFTRHFTAVPFTERSVLLFSSFQSWDLKRISVNQSAHNGQFERQGEVVTRFYLIYSKSKDMYMHTYAIHACMHTHTYSLVCKTFLRR